MDSESDSLARSEHTLMVLQVKSRVRVGHMVAPGVLSPGRRSRELKAGGKKLTVAHFVLTPWEQSLPRQMAGRAVPRLNLPLGSQLLAFLGRLAQSSYWKWMKSIFLCEPPHPPAGSIPETGISCTSNRCATKQWPGVSCMAPKKTLQNRMGGIYTTAVRNAKRGILAYADNVKVSVIEFHAW